VYAECSLDPENIRNSMKEGWCNGDEMEYDANIVSRSV
jgi:hypothetical protein